MKLQQELASILHQPLFQVHIDLRKAYDTADRERLMTVLTGYGMGPNVGRVLSNFWNGQKIVARQNGFHGPIFETG